MKLSLLTIRRLADWLWDFGRKQHCQVSRAWGVALLTLWIHWPLFLSPCGSHLPSIEPPRPALPCPLDMQSVSNCAPSPTSLFHPITTLAVAQACLTRLAWYLLPRSSCLLASIPSMQCPDHYQGDPSKSQLCSEKSLPPSPSMATPLLGALLQASMSPP